MTRAVLVRRGDRYGRLTLIKEVDRIKGRRAFRCKCDCGNRITIQLIKLRATHGTKSCGCLQKEAACINLKLASASRTKHGLAHTRLYRIWYRMLERCENTKHHAYSKYGKRGITVCDEWHDIDAFIEWALAHGYRDHLTIDRRNNDKGYHPKNCRWVTRKRQNRNKRDTYRVNFRGKERALADVYDILAKENYVPSGLKYLAVLKRHIRGWPLKRCMLSPPGTTLASWGGVRYRRRLRAGSSEAD